MDSDWWGSVYIAKEEIELNKKTVSNGYYNTGTFTVLVDESGTPLLYKESFMKGEK